MDNFLTGYATNLQDAHKSKQFEFVEHDVVEPFSGNFDQIYHLACPASPPKYQANPIRTAKIGFLGTLNALELAEKCGATLLLASTSEVYGDPEVHPQVEGYFGNVNPTGPRACYDEGKRIAETLAFDFYRTRQTDIRVARIFNTFGPRMDPQDGRVISNFIHQALSGQNITISGQGDQTRSFCYYSDLIRGLHALMISENTIGPVNLGNPRELNISDVARRILELTGSSSELVNIPLPKDDPKKRKPDISKAKACLNWQPEISFEEGLQKTVAHFRANLMGAQA